MKLGPEQADVALLEIGFLGEIAEASLKQPGCGPITSRPRGFLGEIAEASLKHFKKAPAVRHFVDSSAKSPRPH